ncbi:tryptase isoform X2 [Drosophila hydei]|uniref:Tryptase isoform X2 n=1 Tax=Drosophila hydei TaxID=7224 RepID=A0A6J1L5B8_DROHY|nr:tryptase isoform X2 [Drosophila hydei]
MAAIELMCDSRSSARTINLLWAPCCRIPMRSQCELVCGPLSFELASGRMRRLCCPSSRDWYTITTNCVEPANSFFNRFFELHINGPQSPHRVAPTPVIHKFPEGQTDVQIKTVVFDGSERSISHILSDFVNEQTATSAADWAPKSPAITSISSSAVPRQRWPTSSVPTISSIAPAPWKPATPASPFIPNGIRASPPSSVPWPSFVCGQEGTGVPYIQRGMEFPRGRYPWLTAVYHKESFSLAFKCGGSLVSTSLVITAAHCVYKIREDRVLVALGRYDLDNYSEDGAEMRDARRIVMHPEYSSRLQLQPDADIALITLDSPVIFNDIISPICLWETAETETEAEIGSIAGWGTDENGNSMTRYPRVVDAKIATVGECARRWKVQKILDRTLCAGNLDGSGPCLGDSGGGLMIKRNNRWLLRGVVSLGERSTVDHCNNNQYVLYCDLAKHMTWIRQYIS